MAYPVDYASQMYAKMQQETSYIGQQADQQQPIGIRSALEKLFVEVNRSVILSESLQANFGLPVPSPTNKESPQSGMVVDAIKLNAERLSRASDDVERVLNHLTS